MLQGDPGFETTNARVGALLQPNMIANNSSSDADAMLDSGNQVKLSQSVSLAQVSMLQGDLGFETTNARVGALLQPNMIANNSSSDADAMLDSGNQVELSQAKGHRKMLAEPKKGGNDKKPKHWSIFPSDNYKFMDDDKENEMDYMLNEPRFTKPNKSAN